MPQRLRLLRFILPLLLASLQCLASKKLGKIHTLTSEPYMGDDDLLNFDEVLEARSVLMVDFMVDCLEEAEAGMNSKQVAQCKSSRDLKKPLKKLAKLNPGMTYAQVDVEAEPELAERFGVKDAPALVLFVNGTEPAYYSGDFSQRSIASWIEQATRVARVESEYDLGKLVAARTAGTVLVVGKGTDQVGNMMYETSTHVFQDDGNAHLGYAFVKTDGDHFSLEVHRGIKERAQFEFEPGKEIFWEDFVAFVHKEKAPWFGVVSAENAQAVVGGATRGIVWVYLTREDPAVLAEKHARLFVGVAKKWKKLRFVYVDLTKGTLPSSVPQCEHFPCVVSEKSGVVTKKEFDSEFTESDVNSFLKGALKGKAASVESAEL